MEIREERKISICNADGFTLVELLITMVISGIIAGALYSTYLVQQHSYTNQEVVAEMQQNIRAALMLMSRDIRMAGYDPVGSAGAGFVFATASKLNITVDLNEDGDLVTKNDLNGDGDTDDPGETSDDAGENMTYELYTPTGASFTALHRRVGGQAVAENIQAIEFQYLDGSGNVLPLSSLTNQTGRDKIRSVQVSILARASRKDPKFTNTKTYTTASGTTWGPYNDNYRRRLLITTIQCRNMGL